MSDEKQLELAAKAAGLEFWAHGDGGTYIGNPMRRWNPLTDDGDALRLAADLRLKILPGRHKGDGCTVESQRQGIPGCTTFRDDKREQMRRAIVHVAAEIGKAMP